MRTPTVIVMSSVLIAIAAIASVVLWGAIVPGAIGMILAWILVTSVKEVRQWEKAVILRNGRYNRMAGPGLRFLVPTIDRVATYVDQRTVATEINTEKALTRDTVPVDVDAIMFVQVFDAQRAALEVRDYRSAVMRVAQTTLRETIGANNLDILLSNRKALDILLRDQLDAKTSDWGVHVKSVEIRDVSMPASLTDAMSRVAQASRERDARVTLAEAEVAIADKTLEAARIYDVSPTALQLRQMALVYEMGKNGSTVIVPTEMASSMGSVAAGQAAFAK